MFTGKGAVFSCYSQHILYDGCKISKGGPCCAVERQVLL
jgi:hypothetical protein